MVNLKSDLDSDQAKMLAGQLRLAHESLAGFAQRYIPLIDEMANSLGLDFWWWQPEQTQTLPRGSTNPAVRWCWDFTPLYAFRQSYWNSDQSRSAKKNDLAVTFVTYFNPSFSSKSGVCPDPTKMPCTDPVLRVYVYRAISDSRKKFHELWNSTPPWGKTDAKWKTVSDGELEAIGWEWPLAEIICNPQVVLDTLLPICADTKSKAKPK